MLSSAKQNCPNIIIRQLITGTGYLSLFVKQKLGEQTHVGDSHKICQECVWVTWHVNIKRGKDVLYFALIKQGLCLGL